jgi:hypothetical protein
VRRQSLLRSAMVLSCAQASRPLRAFVTTYRGQADANDAVVTALWRIAECSRRSVPSLTELADAGEAAEQLGTEASEYAAGARFALVDRDFARLTRFRIRVPGGANIEDMVTALERELIEPVGQVRELVQGYARVESLNSARWSAAARQRSGAALEALERAVLAAGWELPEDVVALRRTLVPSGYDMVRRNAEQRANEILRAQSDILRCRAAAHYRRVLELAAPVSLDSEEVQFARERLGEMQIPQRCPRQ